VRLRAAHFACVLLLISTFGAAEGSTLQGSRAGLRGQYMHALLQQGAAAVASEPAFPGRVTHEFNSGLPFASVAQTRTVWTMRPPSEHSTSLAAVTSFGR
jgi:hypothetical protein